MKLLLGLCVALLLPCVGNGHAQELRFGSQGDPSMDPHYLYVGTNVAFWRHVFGSLDMHDPQGHVVPGIAKSYELVDEETWQFNLRPEIVFKDGSKLTADDVVFSLNRVTSIPGNPNSYSSRLESVASVEAIDPLTVRIHTKAPNPYIPDNMADIAIVSKRAVEGKVTGDFATLAAMDEYGPYRVESFSRGEKVVLDRNEAFWGEKPYWKRVVVHVITNDAARVAALLAGDVDFIDFVPPQDVPKLRANPKIAVQDGPSTRLMALLVNFRAGPFAGVSDTEGKPLPVNPLLDVRVRHALSKAIDRRSLVSHVMDNEAEAAGQVARPEMEGYDEKLSVEPYDPQGAKALLREAGFPSGFSLTVSCSNNRYPNDSQVCQAIGQMLARIGLRVTVEALPVSVLLPKLRGSTPAGGDMGLGLVGFGVQGSRPTTLAFVIHSANPAMGRGQYNWGHYENREIDGLIDSALTTLDPALRGERLKLAVDRVYAETVIIPLYWQKVVTASRADLTYTTDASEDTLTWRVLPETPR